MAIDFKTYFNLYHESASEIIWHYSNDPLSILKTDKFSLGTETGADSTKSGHPFYMSTARSKTASYSISNKGIIFKLDGRALNNRYRAKSVDYWNGSEIKPRYKGVHEMEDRIYSKSPTIPNARKYILEIQSWLDIDKAHNIDTFALYVKKVEDMCIAQSIPFIVYRNYKDFISGKNPANSVSDIINLSEIEVPQPYKFKDHRRKNRLKDILLFLGELKDPERNYSRYDSLSILSADYGNTLRRNHGRSAIYAKEVISKILRKLKIDNIDQLFKLRIEQAHKMLKYKNDIKYIDHKLREWVKEIDSNDERDYFNEIYDFNQAYQDSDKEIMREIFKAFKSKNIDSLRGIFDDTKSRIMDKIQNIESTMVKVSINDVVKPKPDESWKNDQI